MNPKIASLALCAGLLFSLSAAHAATDAEIKKAEAAMSKACKNDPYSKKAVAKMTAKEIGEWAETEEKGPKKDAFKKTNCYRVHEEWEEVAENHEEGEEHEHK